MASFFEPLTIWASQVGGYRDASSVGFNEGRGSADRFFIRRLEGCCFSDTGMTCSPLLVERDSFVETWKESPSYDLGVQSRRNHQRRTFNCGRKICSVPASNKPQFNTMKTRFTRKLPNDYWNEGDGDPKHNHQFGYNEWCLRNHRRCTYGYTLMNLPSVTCNPKSN